MENEAQQAIEQLNRHLRGPYKLALMPPAKLSPAPKNARFMTDVQYRRLVDNVSKDGALASVPLCWVMPDGECRVLSGNHRVKAAATAGLPEILVLYTDQALSREDEIGIQLSHNAIVGQDDPIVLRELWDEIDSIASKMYSGLDDKQMAALEAMTMPSISDASIDFRTLALVFLPPEQERLQELLTQARKMISANGYHLARLAEHERLLDVIATVADGADIRNSAVALACILDVFERHQHELAADWLEDYEARRGKATFPLAAVFGSDRVPIAVADKLRKAVARAVDSGSIPSAERWRVLERCLDG